MKIDKIIFATVMAAFGLAMSLGAQVTTNTIPGGYEVVSNGVPNEANFFQNAMTWAGSRYASGLTWATNDLDITTGADYSDNLQWANYISVEKNIKAFYIRAEMDNQGIAGIVSQVSGGAGYTLSNSGDLRIQAGGLVGYKFHSDSFGPQTLLLEPELRMQKLMPGATFVEAAVNYPFYIHGPQSNYPGVQVGVGAWF